MPCIRLQRKKTQWSSACVLSFWKLSCPESVEFRQLNGCHVAATRFLMFGKTMKLCSLTSKYQELIRAESRTYDVNGKQRMYDGLHRKITSTNLSWT